MRSQCMRKKLFESYIEGFNQVVCPTGSGNIPSSGGILP